MATAAKNIVESFREVVQDLLLPEFKALKATAEAQREDSRQLRSDLKDSVGGLRIEIRESLDALRNEMRDPG
jgi:hypothetical protein